MRYFIRLKYDGAAYHGWQSQPGNVNTVQGTIEEVWSKLLREPIEIVGCGRTDTGVHALDYYIHMDSKVPIDERLLGRANMMLPKDIALVSLHEMPTETHARFDATSRSYQYHIHFNKDPFLQGKSYYYPFAELDKTKLQAAAQLLLEYEDFDTFCKTNTDVKTKKCYLTRSEWVFDGNRAVYHISANRFLRGMIRLIVGMCIQVATGKLDLDYVRQQMDTKLPLDKALSAPAEGLYLCDIKYDYFE